MDERGRELGTDRSSISVLTRADRRMYREPKRQWKRKEKGNWRWTEKVQKKQEPDFSLVLPASELNFGAARNKSAEPPSPSSSSSSSFLSLSLSLVVWCLWPVGADDDR